LSGWGLTSSRAVTPTLSTSAIGDAKPVEATARATLRRLRSCILSFQDVILAKEYIQRIELDFEGADERLKLVMSKRRRGIDRHIYILGGSIEPPCLRYSVCITENTDFLN
jgi:hypothetical protein